jgi:hypothetical protein
VGYLEVDAATLFRLRLLLLRGGRPTNMGGRHSRAEGRPGRVEERGCSWGMDDRVGVGLPRTRRRAKAPRAGGWRRARVGQQRDARARFGMDWGERWDRLGRAYSNYNTFNVVLPSNRILIFGFAKIVL